jgi:drug/metabolite transporter (DMT)-like permease
LVVGGLAYIGLATAAVFLLRYRSLKSLSPATVGIYHNLVPVMTVLLAFVWLNEPLGIRTIIGGLAVFAGADLVRRGGVPAIPLSHALPNPSLPTISSHKSTR